MTRGIGRWTLLASLLAGAAFAQAPSETHDISQVAVAPPGATLSIPIPEEDQANPRKYEIPELAGTELAVGSQLIDGRLPKPLADYVTKVGGVLQRISLFENGLVSAHVQGAGGVITKKLIIPADGIAAIRENLTPRSLAQLPTRFGTDPTETNYVLLRVYDDDGKSVERRFHPAAILPNDLERPRAILQDLLRAIAQDREVTNSVAGYVPAIGDRLVGEDQKTYEVTGLSGGGEYVELRSLVDPTQLYIAAKDLHKFFVGKPVSSKR